MTASSFRAQWLKGTPITIYKVRDVYFTILPAEKPGRFVGRFTLHYIT